MCRAAVAVRLRRARRAVLAGLAALPVAACAAQGTELGAMAVEPGAMAAESGTAPTSREQVGGVEMIDPALAAIIDPQARPEVLGSGYGWAEGPVWVPAGYLLFNDPPSNVMYRYVPGGAVEAFLRPSGLAGPVPPGIREAGANGMAMDGQRRVVLADSGTRAIALLDLATMRKTVLVDNLQGRRFNSPNDVAVAQSGAIYFTDPPYGLADAEASPLREVQHNGLYMQAADGTLHLLDRHHRPNGVALSPDERTLYLALSDEERPEVLAYQLGADGMPVGAPRLFHDMRAQLAAGRPGLPDGMDVDAAGNVFATGPGGVHVLAPDGRLLGIIGTGKAVANVAIGEGGRALYLTSHTMLARVPLKGS